MDMTPFQFFLFFGIGLIAAELIIFQLSFFWFLFVGVGALITMLVAFFIPSTSWLVAWAVFVASSTLVSVGLYRPLRKWQDKPGALPGHDAINQAVSVKEEITPEKPGKVIWSGTDWQAFLEEGATESIPAGSTAYISKLEGIRLTVRKNK